MTQKVSEHEPTVHQLHTLVTGQLWEAAKPYDLLSDSVQNERTKVKGQKGKANSCIRNIPSLDDRKVPKGRTAPSPWSQGKATLQVNPYFTLAQSLALRKHNIRCPVCPSPGPCSTGPACLVESSIPNPRLLPHLLYELTEHLMNRAVLSKLRHDVMSLPSRKYQLDKFLVLQTSLPCLG